MEQRINLPHVFLYLISVKTAGEKSVPVAFMLSAQQDYIKIRYFLDRFQQHFAKPKESVMDDSAALLKSCVVSLAECANLNNYVEKCFNVLNGNPQDLPKCFVRLDVAHYVHCLHRNKLLKKMKSEARQLYLCTFGFLIQCSDYTAIKTIAEHLITLLNVPIFGEISGNVLPSTQSQKKLVNLVRSHEIRFVTDREEEQEKQNEDDYTNESEQQLGDFCAPNEDECEGISFYDDILNKVLKNWGETKAAKSNIKCQQSLYYNPELNKYFKKQLNRLPLWTNVMNEHFHSTSDVGISTDTEARFNVIKNVVFKDLTLPIRPDIFVQRLLNDANNLATLNRLEMKHKQNILELVSPINIFVWLKTDSFLNMLLE